MFSFLEVKTGSVVIMLGRRILLINFVLLASIAVCAYQIHGSWKKFEETQMVKRVIVSAIDSNSEVKYDSEFVFSPEELEHDFFEVYQRDLFSPDRSPSSEDSGEDEEEKPPEFPKRPQMNGASTIGGQLSAFLTVYSNAKSPGESKSVVLGDDVQGYTVAAITDTTVTLKWNEYQEIIDMADNEPLQVAQKGPQQLAAVNIIRIGSALAAVETTTSDEDQGEESKGLQIGVVAAQNSRGGSQTGIAGRMQGGANQMGRGMTGRSSRNPGLMSGRGGSRNLQGGRIP